MPETMKNYLALLGWSTTDSQQIFKKGELEEKFDLKGCQKSPAIFDPVKLAWMNGEYIRLLSREDMLAFSMPFIKGSGLDPSASKIPLLDIVALEQEKCKLLAELPGKIEFFFKDPVYNPEAVEKTLKAPEVTKILNGIKEAYAALAEFKEAPVEAATRAFAKANGYKAGQVFHPVRVALSGRAEGPTLFRMIEYIGKEESLKRLDKALTLI